MHRILATIAFLSLAAQARAADLTGQALLSDGPPHDGITVTVDTDFASLPVMGGLGVLALVVGVSLCLERTRKPASLAAGLLLGVGVVYAAVVGTDTTAVDGNWTVTGIDAGTYSLRFSATGYEDAFLEPVQVGTDDLTLPTVTLQKALTAGGLYGTDTIVGDLRYVPAGAFTQGSPLSEACRETLGSPPLDEDPFSHTLTRDIVVMETEVSRKMWEDLLAAQPTLGADPSSTSSFGSPTLDHPVQRLSWYQALLFANLLSVEQGLQPAYSVKDGSVVTVLDASNYDQAGVEYLCDFDASGYRLPTEGEWEYFTRAGTTGPFSVVVPDYNAVHCNTSSCISTPTLPELDAVAWFCVNSGFSPEPVGTKLPNPWGLHDVHGNLFEWTWDWEDDYPTSPQTDYEGPASGTVKIVRGGAAQVNAGFIRSALRSAQSPGVTFASNLGFRLVRTL